MMEKGKGVVEKFSFRIVFHNIISLTKIYKNENLQSKHQSMEDNSLIKKYFKLKKKQENQLKWQYPQKVFI